MSFRTQFCLSSLLLILHLGGCGKAESEPKVDLGQVNTLFQKADNCNDRDCDVGGELETLARKSPHSAELSEACIAALEDKSPKRRVAAARCTAAIGAKRYRVHQSRHFKKNNDDPVPPLKDTEAASALLDAYEKEEDSEVRFQIAMGTRRVDTRALEGRVLSLLATVRDESRFHELGALFGSLVERESAEPSKGVLGFALKVLADNELTSQLRPFRYDAIRFLGKIRYEDPRICEGLNNVLKSDDWYWALEFAPPQHDLQCLDVQKLFVLLVNALGTGKPMRNVAASVRPLLSVLNAEQLGMLVAAAQSYSEDHNPGWAAAEELVQQATEAAARSNR